MKINAENLAIGQLKQKKKIKVISNKSYLSAYDQLSLFSAYKLEKLTAENKEFDPNNPIEQMKKMGIIQSPEQTKKAQIASKIQAITAKLKSGIELNTSELEFLREHAPDLYSKAMQIARERKEYRKELERCKTKDEVARLNANKMGQFTTEVRALNSTPGGSSNVAAHEFISMRIAAINNEHYKFIISEQYEELPYEHEILNGEKKPVRNKKRRNIKQDIAVKVHISGESTDAKTIDKKV